VEHFFVDRVNDDLSAAANTLSLVYQYLHITLAT
jgi:hypothetical protein